MDDFMTNMVEEHNLSLKNKRMAEIMAAITLGAGALNGALTEARYDEDETDGTWSIIANQSSAFIRFLKVAIYQIGLIETNLGIVRCPSCYHTFTKEGTCIRYDDDPNYDPDEDSCHNYPPRPCKTGECEKWKKEGLV